MVQKPLAASHAVAWTQRAAGVQAGRVAQEFAHLLRRAFHYPCLQNVAETMEKKEVQC